MTRLKLLAAMAAAVALTAMSAAPASATFKSLLATKGHASLTAVSFATGGLKVTCASGSGEWHLQTKGKFEETEHKTGKTEEDKQVATLSGPHLYIAVAEWSGCKGEVLGIKVAATVEACEFQVVQTQKGTTKGTMSVVTECVLKTAKPFGCTITLSAGKEASGTNAFLKEVKLENGHEGLLAMAPAVEGISGTTNCEKEGAGKFTNGTMTGEAESLTTEGGLMLG